MIDESLGKVTAEAVATPEPIVAGGYTASQIKAMTDYAVHTHFRKAMAEAIAGKPEKDADQKAVEDGLAKAVQQIKAGWGMPAAGAAPQQPHSDDDVMAKAVASLKASMGRR